MAGFLKAGSRLSWGNADICLDGATLLFTDVHLQFTIGDETKTFLGQSSAIGGQIRVNGSKGVLTFNVTEIKTEGVNPRRTLSGIRFKSTYIPRQATPLGR